MNRIFSVMFACVLSTGCSTLPEEHAISERENANAESAPLEHGVTRLGSSILNVQPDSVRQIIKAGADVNEPMEGGISPLFLALSVWRMAASNEPMIRYSRDIVEMLVAAGADINNTGPFGLTPLHLAASRNDDDLIRVLLSAGARVNALSDKGQTPLIIAAQCHCGLSVEALLKNGADPAIADRPCGNTALHYAIITSSFGSAMPLCQGKALSNIGDRQGFTPLHWAVVLLDANAAKLLLKYGADTSAKGRLDDASRLAAVNCGRLALGADNSDFGRLGTYRSSALSHVSASTRAETPIELATVLIRECDARIQSRLDQNASGSYVDSNVREEVFNNNLRDTRRRDQLVKVAQLMADINQLRTAVQLYEADTGHAIVEMDDLEQDKRQRGGWRGPYITNGIPKDPWGKPYALTDVRETHQ